MSKKIDFIPVLRIVIISIMVCLISYLAKENIIKNKKIKNLEKLIKEEKIKTAKLYKL